ncbi:Protein SRG1 [Glycine soja]
MSGTNATNQTIEHEDETRPLWKYVSRTRKIPHSRNDQIKCNICEIPFNESYTRVKVQLLKISIITPSKLVKLKKLDNEASLKIKNSNKNVSLYLHSRETNIGANPTKKHPIEASFNVLGKYGLDWKIARMFYSPSLPFHLVRNPYYRKTFSYATNSSNIHGYVLQVTIENHLAYKGKKPCGEPIAANNKFMSDPQRKPLINFMTVTESGPMYLRALDCLGEVKDKDFITKHLRDVIMEVEPSNMIQFVTDNVVFAHKSRVSFPYVVHTLNLALKNICSTKNTERKMLLTNNKFDKKGSKKWLLVTIWSSYKEDDVNMALFVKETLFSDICWYKDATSLHLVYEMWDSVIEKVRKAIYLYERKEEIEESTFYVVVHSILLDRWIKSSTPIHCLAHCLNPSEDSHRLPPHQDVELTLERNKCFKRYFVDVNVKRHMNVEFANFFDGREGFDDVDSLRDRGILDAILWWLVHGDEFGPLDDNGILEVAHLSLDEPKGARSEDANQEGMTLGNNHNQSLYLPKGCKSLIFGLCNHACAATTSLSFRLGHMEGLVVQEATISPPVVEVLKEDGPSTSGARTPWSIYQNSILTKLVPLIPIPLQDMTSAAWFVFPNLYTTKAIAKKFWLINLAGWVLIICYSTLLHEKAIDDAELDKLFTACKDWGFFQVANHGVSSQQREKLKLEIEKFFKLPIEEKKKYQIRAGDVQGYGTIKSLTGGGGDRFYMVINPLERRKPHLLPGLPTSLRDTLKSYFRELTKLGMELLGLLGRAISMEMKEVMEIFDDGIMTYYPPCPKPELVAGLTPHSDATGITILHQVNGVEGLEIKKGGVWIPVTFLPDAFVVNIGDIMEHVVY